MTQSIGALTWQDQSDPTLPMANYGLDFSVDSIWQFNLAGTYHLDPILPLGVTVDNSNGAGTIRALCAAYTVNILPFTRIDLDLTNVSQQITFTGLAGITYTLPIVFWRKQPSGAQQNYLAVQQTAIANLVVRTTVFSAPGTTSWIPQPSLIYADAEAWGGGGAGGGAAIGVTTNSGTPAGGGGAAGSYARKLITKVAAGGTQSVTIGSGAPQTAVGNVNGAAGGDTSLGALMLAKGGSGGTGMSAGIVGGTGGLGVVAGNVGDVTGPGMSGATATVPVVSGAAPGSLSGVGGSAPPIGSGGRGQATPATFANGEAAIGFASGGSGGISLQTTGARGGAGTGGYLIIIEYCTS